MTKKVRVWVDMRLMKVLEVPDDTDIDDTATMSHLIDTVCNEFTEKHGDLSDIYFGDIGVREVE